MPNRKKKEECRIQITHNFKAKSQVNKFFTKEIIPASLGTALQQWIPLLRMKFISLWSSSIVHGPLFKPALSQQGCLPILEPTLLPKHKILELTKGRALKKQLNWGWSKDAASSFRHLNKGKVSFERGDKWLDGSYFSWKLWKACKGCHYNMMLTTTLLQTRSRVSVQPQNFSMQEKITTLLTILHYLDPKSSLVDTIPCKHHKNIEFDGIPLSQVAGKLCPFKQFPLFIFHHRYIYTSYVLISWNSSIDLGIGTSVNWQWIRCNKSIYKQSEHIFCFNIYQTLVLVFVLSQLHVVFTRIFKRWV